MLKNRVAIVTGSGQGLGYHYAHALAKEGCRVVINDIGCSVHGDSVATQLAETVANEFNTKYGPNTAIASCSPVSFDKAHEILDITLQKFKRVDILINNAGIVRDKVFEKTEDKDWSLLVDVHLSGVYKLSQLVYNQFKKQGDGYGKILFISSIAVFGSFGQTAYSALKSSLIGLCHSIANECATRGFSYNVNTILPLADTRILRTANLPEQVINKLQIDPILPAITYFSSPLCSENGGIFEVAGGRIYRIFLKRSKGVSFSSAMDLKDGIKSLEPKQFPTSNEAILHLFEDLNQNTTTKPREQASSIKMANEQLTKLFEQIQKNITSMSKDDKLPNNKFIFALTEGKFLLDLDKRTLAKVESDDVKADVTITMKDEDFIELMEGKANAQTLFFSKKLQIGGNMGLAMKLIQLREKLVKPTDTLQSKL